MRSLLLLFLILLNSLVVAQQEEVNRSSTEERFKVAIELLNDEPDSTIHIITNNLEQGVNDSTFLIRHYNIRGIAHYYSAHYEEALNDLFNVLAYWKQQSDTSQLISTKSNIALVLGDMANYSQALKYLIGSEELIRKPEDYIYVYTNLGYIYENLKEYEIALDYHLKSLKLDSIRQDSAGLALDYINVGVQYLKLKQFDRSGAYLLKGELLSKLLNDQRSLALSLLNLGTLAAIKKEFAKSKAYFDQCLAISNQSENHRIAVKALADKADAIGFGIGDPTAAISIAEEGFERAKNYQITSEEANLTNLLYRLYKELGDPEKAMHYLELFNDVNDSLDKINRSREFVAYELEYRFEKESLKDSLQHAKELSIKNVEIQKKEQAVNQKNNQLILGSIGLLVFGLLSLLLFRRYRITNKQKKVIINQKENLEEKGKEIAASIAYAKRIQKTILPSLTGLPSYIKDHFIYYKPKDVVSGDFYWMEEFNGKLYLAVADCTGHGVPGAMVSVICSRALSRALNEERITEVDLILNRVREIIVKQFLSESGIVKDGMDISLIAIEQVKEGFTIDYAGAYNPLMIITKDQVSEDLEPFVRKRRADVSLLELAADKQPVGYSFEPKSFSKRSFHLSKGAQLYLLTDGAQDQFGGPNGKKFKRSAIRDLFISNTDRTMEDCKQNLVSALEQWMHSEAQVDDICVLGITLD